MDQVKSYVFERFAELEKEWVRWKRQMIIDEVKAKFDEIIDEQFVKYWCKKKVKELKWKIDEKLHELNDAVEEKKHYDIEGENVVFHIRKQSPDGSEYVAKYAIPFDELEEIWYDYSSHWANLSGKKLLVKHELKRETLALLRNRMWLTKDENAIPRELLEYWQETKWEAYVEEKIVEVTHRAYEDKFKKKFDLADKREVDRLVRLGMSFETQLQRLNEILMDYDPIKIDFVPDSHEHNDDVLNVFFSDLHFGNGNDSDIINRFDEIFKYVVSQPHKHVNVCCLGDLGESFAPEGMHKGQLKHMSMHGHKLTMFIVKVFEKFLLGLHRKWKVVTFMGKWGNHDRTSEEHWVDDEKTMAWVIYEIIKRWLQEFEIEIDYYFEDISTFAKWNIHFIAHHGDEWFSNRKAETILWNNGDQSKYNVIIHGDKHNVTVREAKNATMIGLPALAGKGKYDTKLDLHSAPGAVIVTENKYWTADVFIKRLP